jgi:hypothetical protein
MNIEKLIFNATLAPSGHNTQPWTFSANDHVVRIFPDFNRTLPVVDPDNHALYISLGCALENLLISAKQDGLKCSVDYFPEDEPKECLRVTLTDETTRKEIDLFKAIPERKSNRSMYDHKSIPSADIEQLLQVNESKTVTVQTFDTKNKEIDPIIELVKEACEIQFNDRQFVKELISWIRFSKKEVRTQRDGLTAEVMGFPYIPRWLGRFILKTFIKPESESNKTEKQIRSSSHLFLFICEKSNKRNWIEIGQTFQRIALKATSIGLSHAHINMPCEVESVRKKLSSHLQLSAKNEPLLLIRLGYAGEVPRAPRRSVDEVLINEVE